MDNEEKRLLKLLEVKFPVVREREREREREKEREKERERERERGGGQSYDILFY